MFPISSRISFLTCELFRSIFYWQILRCFVMLWLLPTFRALWSGSVAVQVRSWLLDETPCYTINCFFSGVPLLLERNAYSLIVEDGILFMSCRSNLLTVLVKYSVALLIFNLFYVSTAKRAVLISPPAWLHLFLLALPSVFALRQWC